MCCSSNFSVFIIFLHLFAFGFETGKIVAGRANLTVRFTKENWLRITVPDFDFSTVARRTILEERV
jgi:hypothetical protein